MLTKPQAIRLLNLPDLHKIVKFITILPNKTIGVSPVLLNEFKVSNPKISWVRSLLDRVQDRGWEVVSYPLPYPIIVSDIDILKSYSN